MKKRISADVFSQLEKAFAGEIEPKTFNTAKQCLVLGRKQKDVAEELGLYKTSVSYAVLKVWEFYQRFLEQQLPPGFERVTVILPEVRALQVKKWGEECSTLLSKMKQEVSNESDNHRDSERRTR